MRAHGLLVPDGRQKPMAFMGPRPNAWKSEPAFRNRAWT